MSKPVYVTGNPNKAKYFNLMTRLDLDHVSADVDEIQSLDVKEVVEHKVKQAYELLQRPVIVEDAQLGFNALDGLPGPLVKWFIESIGLEKMCRLLDAYDDRSAVAGAAIAYYDGSMLEIFEKSLSGRIAEKPLGDSGFGWNRIFVPDGSDKSLGQMDDEEFKTWYTKIKPFEELTAFLTNQA